MANKTYSFYSSDNEYVPNSNDSLVFEIGKTHLVFIVHNDAGIINAVEWFTIDAEEKKDIGALVEVIKETSLLAGRPYMDTTLLFNNCCNVIMPKNKFRVEHLHDTIQAALGSTIEFICQFDDLKEDPGFVNAYRIPANMVEVLRRVMPIDKVQHSYTRFLLHNLHNTNTDASYLQAYLYHDEIVVTLLLEGNLQYMHAFNYQNADDVVYHLMNLCTQFNLNAKTFEVKLSGFLDEHPDMYNFLTRFFKNIQFETYPIAKINLQTGDYPLYYFTPIFNLVP